MESSEWLQQDKQPTHECNQSHFLANPCVFILLLHSSASPPNPRRPTPCTHFSVNGVKSEEGEVSLRPLSRSLLSPGSYFSSSSRHFCCDQLVYWSDDTKQTTERAGEEGKINNKSSLRGQSMFIWERQHIFGFGFKSHCMSCWEYFFQFKPVKKGEKKKGTLAI